MSTVGFRGFLTVTAIMVAAHLLMVSMYWFLIDDLFMKTVAAADILSFLANQRPGWIAASFSPFPEHLWCGVGIWDGKMSTPKARMVSSDMF